MNTTVFWSVLALVYLVSAIVIYLSSKPIMQAFAALAKFDSLVSDDPKTGREVGLESTLYEAYKWLIITDIGGFVLTAVAAIASVAV